MLLTPAIPDDIEVLIGNMRVNKRADLNTIPTKILKDYISEFSKSLSDMTKTFLQQAYSPVLLQ